jgi:membrane protein CcdC involved in cytochrome C biogenesis
MITFLAGALTASYLVAALFFFKFWRKTHDRLFSHFALAFVFFALNQIATTIMEVNTERGSFIYLLRIAGYVLILIAIIEKNRGQRKKPPESGSD